MGRRKKSDAIPPKREQKAPITSEERENELIRLATNLAEKQLREGTASSQVITHYLKLGTTKEKMEKKLLAKQIELTGAKANAILNPSAETQKYEEAIKAMRKYAGQDDQDL